MKHLLLLRVAVLLACTSCASAGNPDDVRARILHLDAEWSQAAQGRDIDRIVSYWADDATVLPPGSPPVVGKPAIRAASIALVGKLQGTVGWRWAFAALALGPALGVAACREAARIAQGRR